MNLQREYDEALAVVAYGAVLYELTKHGVWIDRDNLRAERIFEDEGLETEKRGREEKEIEGSAPFGDGKRHELKIWPEHFAAVTHPDKLRRKTVEIRKDDRGYRVGDVLILREWDPESEAYTGQHAEALITHILRGWVLQEGWVALSILLLGDGVR
ncbi:MAG TPA: DUF3850 domain-containing protein [Alicyclobacillus sp.]|nr:DUF3850 domain-containing protein [Alicyclobacillus sp.]